jgi:hypothetical protein
VAIFLACAYDATVLEPRQIFQPASSRSQSPIFTGAAAPPSDGSNEQTFGADEQILRGGRRD